MLNDRLNPRRFELGILDSLCQADTEETRAMKDGKTYFEDMDRITQEVIIDLFVSILENKLRERERGPEEEKSDEQGDASHSRRGKSQRKKCKHP